MATKTQQNITPAIKDIFDLNDENEDDLETYKFQLQHR